MPRYSIVKLRHFLGVLGAIGSRWKRLQSAPKGTT